jgi:hypothetical protein
MEGIKVNLFRVEPDHESAAPLSDVLRRAAKHSLEKRTRLVGGQQVRLEAVQEESTGLFLMDFVLMRNRHGPGRCSPRKAIRGFDFDRQDREVFGEETAALYDPNTSHMVIEYNHHGTRAGKIADYLSGVTGQPNDQYTLEIRMNEEMEAQLQHRKIVRGLRIKASTQSMGLVDKRADRSITAHLAAAREAGAPFIDIYLSVGKSRSERLDRNLIDRAYEWAKARLRKDPGSVDAFDVSAKVDVDDATQTLKMLGHSISHEFKNLTVGADLRIPRDERWEALLRAHKEWRKIMRV